MAAKVENSDSRGSTEAELQGLADEPPCGRLFIHRALGPPRCQRVEEPASHTSAHAQSAGQRPLSPCATPGRAPPSAGDFVNDFRREAKQHQEVTEGCDGDRCVLGRVTAAACLETSRTKAGGQLAMFGDQRESEAETVVALLREAGHEPRRKETPLRPRGQ